MSANKTCRTCGRCLRYDSKSAADSPWAEGRYAIVRVWLQDHTGICTQDGEDPTAVDLDAPPLCGADFWEP